MIEFCLLVLFLLMALGIYWIIDSFDFPTVPKMPAAKPILEHRVQCAWCGMVMREGDPGAPTSHGICQKDRDHLRARARLADARVKHVVG